MRSVLQQQRYTIATSMRIILLLLLLGWLKRTQARQVAWISPSDSEFSALREKRHPEYIEYWRDAQHDTECTTPRPYVTDPCYETTNSDYAPNPHDYPHFKAHAGTALNVYNIPALQGLPHGTNLYCTENVNTWNKIKQMVIPTNDFLLYNPQLGTKPQQPKNNVAVGGLRKPSFRNCNDLLYNIRKIAPCNDDESSYGYYQGEGNYGLYSNEDPISSTEDPSSEMFNRFGKNQVSGEEQQVGVGKKISKTNRVKKPKNNNKQDFDPQQSFVDPDNSEEIPKKRINKSKSKKKNKRPLALDSTEIRNKAEIAVKKNKKINVLNTDIEKSGELDPDHIQNIPVNTKPRSKNRLLNDSTRGETTTSTTTNPLSGPDFDEMDSSTISQENDPTSTEPSEETQIAKPKEKRPIIIQKTGKKSDITIPNSKFDEFNLSESEETAMPTSTTSLPHRSNELDKKKQLPDKIPPSIKHKVELNNSGTKSIDFREIKRIKNEEFQPFPVTGQAIDVAVHIGPDKPHSTPNRLSNGNFMTKNPDKMKNNNNKKTNVNLKETPKKSEVELQGSDTNIYKYYSRPEVDMRICVVESKGIYRKTPKFCPILESKSNIECVVGVDRLDCVRRIHKGTAHFGVLSSEDLVAARWASVEILVTSEMRSHNSNFEYEVVAVVDNEADIHSVNDLRGAKLCHPGTELESHWTEALSNYFESTLVSKSCDPDISITEDRIRATARFFGPSCKAGSWVSDPIEDRKLKDRYPSLCQMCYDPYLCRVGDKHWGRRGALYCLTSGGGTVAWARLDDVRSHFGLTGLARQADLSEYSFVCPEGHLQPINNTTPCVWVAKPWPVVAARRSHAAQVQKLVTGLNHDDLQSWQSALLSLLETYHVNIIPLDNVVPINDYLDQAPAFQSAYSFPECNPPRSIVYCTTSIIQHIKCSWLQEASQVYGVEPNIQCIRSTSLDTCMDDTKYKSADVVLVDHENRLRAQRDYKLKPILFEFSHDMHDRYVTIALVHKDAKFQNFLDLKGVRACLPSFEGPTYLSVLDTIANLSKSIAATENFFHKKSCTWDPNARHKCPEYYRGDEGALRCLAEGADVAFLSSDVYKRYTVGNLTDAWVRDSRYKSFKVLCPYGGNERGSKFEYCYLHWTTRGHLMIHDMSTTRRNEIYNSLREMDRLFGKKYPTEIRPFTMYGVFDKRNNILFRDNTDGLRGVQDFRKEQSQRIMEEIFHKYANQFYTLKNSGVVIQCLEKYFIIILFTLWYFN